MADITRRGFLGAILAAAAAPAIAKAESLMRVKPIVLPGEAEFVDISTSLEQFYKRTLIDGRPVFYSGVRLVPTGEVLMPVESAPSIARRRMKEINSHQLRELKRLTGATSTRLYPGDGPVVLIHPSLLDDVLRAVRGG